MIRNKKAVMEETFKIILWIIVLLILGVGLYFLLNGIL